MFRGRSVVKFARRTFSTAKPGEYKAKTTAQVWLGDSGAYPIMGIITFASAMAVVASVYRMAYSNNPDAQIDKTVRKALFRGDVKE